MDNYPRRPGSDDSGRDYEIKITALLSLRYISMKNTTDMWIGSNVDKIGDLDDIVLYNRKLDGTSTVYMIQLKHQETPKNITQGDFFFSAKNSIAKKKKWKEDFSLTKYCEGYTILKEKIYNRTEDELEIIKHLRRVNKIILVLYTNKGVTKCEFLSNVQGITELEFLNTSNNVIENIYKFDHNHSRLNYNKEFLQQLVLLTNQSHANELDKLIKKEIKLLTGFSKADIDYKEVINKFVSFIKIWIKETEIKTKSEDTKIHLTLRKEDIINTLTDIILQPYKVNLGKDLGAVGDSPVWNDLVVDKTVTVVDSDETVTAFLKQYIGSLVRNYSNVKTWIEDLSKKAQELFYKEHNELVPYMIKIAGNIRNITMLDVYKCLWFTNQAPLLLEIQTEEDFKIIRKILKLFKYNLKVIIINNSKECLLNITDIPRHFMTLKNLNHEDRVKILNFGVRLQGRSTVSLGNLIDKSMYEYINCNDIIHILLGNFNIGNIYEPLSECFINRSLSKVIYETKILRDVQDIFVIHNSGGKIGFKDFINCEIQYVDLSNKKNVILSEDTNSKLNFGTRPVHRLNYWYDGYMEWKESLGSTENIRQFQLIEPKTLHKYLKGWKLPQNIDDFWIDLHGLVENDFFKTTIINACPGMGKSILLNFISLKAPPNTWVMKINLNEHYDYYEKIRRNPDLKTLDHLNYFNDAIIEKYSCENIKLTKAVIEKLFKLKKILVLLDGFDEISISYKNEVTELAKMLHEEGLPIWLTTRPVMKQHLEDEFDITSNTLKPFGLEEQKEFLVKYFSGNNTTEDDLSLIRDFSDQLLEAARNNLKDRGCEFTGIPLQTRLLADAFKNDCTKSLQAGTITFNDKFDLLYLYQKFIDDKNDILCGKFGFGVKEMRIFFENHQQLFALKTLFHKDDLSGLNLDEKLSEYYEDQQQKIQFLQREGVVVVEQNKTGTVEKFNVDFVHRTFAEYLAAKWLSENFNNRNELIEETARILLKIRFEHMYNFPFLFNIFDRLVAKNCPLHLGIINGRLEDSQGLIKSNPETINKLDKAGRNALHIIAAYGAFHSENITETTNIHDELVNLLENIPSGDIKNVQDELYGYGPLDYAIASRSLAIANKLCEKSEVLDFHVEILMKDDIFTYCDLYEYKYLFKIILPYFVSADLLLKQIEPDTTLVTYCTLETNESDSTNILQYAKERGVTTLLEMFQTKPNNYYKDIQFAAAFGTKENVLALLSENIDVNEDDVHNNMPIHYAAIHGRLEIVKLLLSKGADFNEPGELDNTPIHYAAKFGHNEIIQELLSSGVDINQQNYEYDTPLLLALMNEEVDTAKFLLSNGAIGDIQNDLKDSALCCAAEIGYVDILSELLKSCNKIINMQYEMNRTLLHYALNGPWNYESMDLENQKSIVTLLLDNGIDVNLQDEIGDTALHDASKYNVRHPKGNEDLKKFFEDIVILLLAKGADHNVKNINGKTALDLAIEGENTKSVSVLEKLTYNT